MTSVVDRVAACSITYRKETTTVRIPTVRAGGSIEVRPVEPTSER